MFVELSASLCEPLLSLNHTCQHVLYSCVSCQYVPAPKSSRQIRLHVLYSANKVTWRLWGKILHCAAAGSCCGRLFFRVIQSKRKHIMCWTHKHCRTHCTESHTYSTQQTSVFLSFSPFLSLSHMLTRSRLTMSLKVFKAEVSWRRKWTISGSQAD